MIRKKSGLVLGLFLPSALIALASMTSDERWVAAPAFGCILALVWLWTTLWDRDGDIPLFDVGVICAAATTVYTVYPLINYWAGGLQFGASSDTRLSSFGPNPYEIGLFHLRHVLYFFSFTFAYAFFRGKGQIITGNLVRPQRRTCHVVVATFVLLTGYYLLLHLLTGVNFNASYEANTFYANLDLIREMPLYLRQISLKLGGLLFVTKMALLAIVVRRCREHTWRLVLVLWIAAEIFETILIKGARTNLVLFVIAAVLMYHRAAKRLSIRFLSVSGASILVLFLFLGMFRAYSDLGALKSDVSLGKVGILESNNEFQVLLGTAYHIYELKREDASFPWYIYINDFINILPPQQLLPFEKVPASEWYLRSLGLSEAGIGLMWGVIAQSVAGLDWIELALRGLILGFALARVHRWYVGRQTGMIETVLYCCICVVSYYTFRDSTGYLLAYVLWSFLPFYVLIRVTSPLEGRAVRPSGSTRVESERPPAGVRKAAIPRIPESLACGDNIQG